jgi:CBS domain-containing protein
MQTESGPVAKKFPTLAANIAWRWYLPRGRAELLDQYHTEQNLVRHVVGTLKRGFASLQAFLHLKNDYRSLQEFLSDAIKNAVLFSSANALLTLRPESTIYEGMLLMADNNIRRIPLVDAAGALKGIFTVRDIIRLLARVAKYEDLYRAEHDDLDLVLAKDVRHIAATSPLTIAASHSVAAAVRTMMAMEIGGLPIVRDGRLIGILTERDVLYLIPLLKELSGKPEAGDLSRFMQKNVVTIASDTPIIEAIKIMAHGHFRRLPIVDSSRLVGIITTTDIMQANYSLGQLFSEILRFPVREIMIQNTCYVTASDTLEAAVGLMGRRNIGSLLIMDGDRLRGIVTERDVLKYAAELVGAGP